MWLKHRELFLQEMIRLEGRCNRLGAQSCSECNCPSPEYRCRDCLGSEIYCLPCILLAHVRHPLHRLELCHTTGQKCLNPRRAFNDDFIVVDTHGIHKVSLDFCNCATAQSHIQQLLQISYPKTTATFRILEHYHLLSFESKVSAFEFYNALSRMSDNTGLLPIKDRYDSFTRMIREWCHLKMLKHSGRDGTVEGECTVLCPACPHPGKNLPAGWKDAPQHLKHKAVSSDSVDPSLSRGWGYFVEDKAYKDFLHSGADSVQEKSTCSSHNAVNMADTKSNRGLATTGLGTVDCARHNMKLPNAVGDLQKGERYINMDYLFFSALHHTVLDTLNVSYDIACQWHKKLWHRMSAFPISMHLSHAIKTISFFAGLTEKHQNVAGPTSTLSLQAPKKWGLAHRRDTLDNYFGDSNWKKVVGLAFEDLNDGLRGEYGATLKQWREQVEAWEYDPAQPNPFERKAETVTMASVRLELAREDEINLQTGTCLALHEDCTPSILISTGLELQEQQRRMKANRAGLGVHATDNQEGKMVQQSNTLRRRIDTWMKIQELYMPSLAALRVRESSVSGSVTAAPEAIKLWLPSQISRTAPCNSLLQVIEWKLRMHKTAILKYKDRNLRGQGANTRARNTLKAVEVRIEAAASTYEYAHKALVVLSPRVNQTGWHSSLRLLDRADVRSMTDLLWGETEGTRKLSWIWNMRGAAANEIDKDNASEDMRIEWCKARARAMRWAEEVELLKEEMRRILQFLEWDAQRWDERGLENTLEDAGEDERKGRMAYAKRQASLRRMLAETFKTSWTDTLALVDTFDHNSLVAQQDMDMDT
ncbi:hypothetical protein DFH29DRAFT_985500 [Suillus ampliporus]|nr:hypothetical protein DFH29DRAFT_985500 [Suillus ampliporus]